jgi:hypothetical protein
VASLGSIRGRGEGRGGEGRGDEQLKELVHLKEVPPKLS